MSIETSGAIRRIGVEFGDPFVALGIGAKTFFPRTAVSFAKKPQSEKLSREPAELGPPLHQWQAQPPPQQLLPPPENSPDDLADAPLAEPFPALKTESWIALRLPAHFGQAISCCLFSTIFSKCVWQSSQMYS